jgi:peroxiredoxin
VIREVAKYGLVLAVILTAALVFVRLEDTKGYGLRTGTPAPLFHLADLKDGKDVDLRSFQGKLVLVNFWATWCVPCVVEMPSLESLDETLGREGLVVLGVSVDEDRSDLERFLAEKKIRFPILRDPGGRVAATAYRTTGWPETFVIGPTGVLLESYVGATEWDTPGALRHFRDLLRSVKTSPTR